MNFFNKHKYESVNVKIYNDIKSPKQNNFSMPENKYPIFVTKYVGEISLKNEDLEYKSHNIENNKQICIIPENSKPEFSTIPLDDEHSNELYSDKKNKFLYYYKKIFSK